MTDGDQAKGSSFGSSAILLQRPAAFRPLLTKGLALSGESYFLKNTTSSYQRGRFCQYGKRACEDYPLLCQTELNGANFKDKNLLISIRNVAWKGRNWKTTFQEEVLARLGTIRMVKS
jgi:hypothetical protein